MSLLPYGLARPFLFGLDAETAHELTMTSLAHTQGTPLAWAYCGTRVQDPVQVAGLNFPNRIGLAAGLDKNARCIDGLGEFVGGLGVQAEEEGAGKPVRQ